MNGLNEFVDDIVKQTTGKGVVIGMQNKRGEVPVFWLDADGEITVSEIRFKFERGVGKRHRTVKVARETLATAFTERGLDGNRVRVMSCKHEYCLGKILAEVWPHLVHPMHRDHPTVQ